MRWANGHQNARSIRGVAPSLRVGADLVASMRIWCCSRLKRIDSLVTHHNGIMTTISCGVS